ncbi:putative ubiquitin-conjugating enzyme E2 39 [Capsicum annuum]|nr:putative ubiquitin-conjugating enzyme E2 39 [Capsicum annuum]KAF3624949.1 putative ubiquitin-conjugating enzyme E2 39 [Capsicum annuum]
MDLLRAVIVGAFGTPYHDGLFFFYIFFPSDYPNQPLNVRYLSRGYHMNPNLYTDGYVYLSLVNTWIGTWVERWNSKTSTILQLLISIQGLVLNAQPY